MLNAIWKWISNDTNRNTLGWLGAGAATLVAAWWTFHTHEQPPAASASVQAPTPDLPQNPPASAPAQPAPSVQTVIAGPNGIAINAGGDAHVTKP